MRGARRSPAGRPGLRSTRPDRTAERRSARKAEAMGTAPDRADERMLESLRARLGDTRLTAGLGDGWSLGTDRAYLRDLLSYWADGFDWRAAEARLLALPWVRSS